MLTEGPVRMVPASGFSDAGQHAEQRRLAGAVRPDDADDRAGRELERQVVDQQAFAECLAEVRDLDHEVAEPRTRRDIDLVRLVARLEFHGGQLVELAQARLALRLARLGIGAHPFEFARERAPQALLLLLLLREPLLLLLEPGGVVALPGNAVPAVELEDPAGHVVEEVAVVGHADDRARVLLEVFLEPGDGLRVEVVGRLVEQQHVGLRQQQPAERDAAALAAGELRHLRFPGRQAQRVGRDVELALEVVAIDGREEGFELPLFRGELVEVRVGFAVERVDLLEARERVLDRLHRLFDDAAHVGRRVQLRLLRQQADLDPGLRPGLALDVRVGARHDAQQRGLARAIQPEDADLGAREEGEGDVAEDVALRRYDLADAVHRINVLGHAIPGLRRAADYQRCGPLPPAMLGSAGPLTTAAASRG